MRRKYQNDESPIVIPSDWNQALRMYDEFHQLDIKRVAKLRLKIPKQAFFAGHVTWTYYESDKWENVPHAYKHEHGAGVKFCWVNENEAPTPTELIEIPEWLQKVKTIVNLGASLGCEYKAPDGEIVDVDTQEPYPDLWTTPDGTALIITEHNPLRIAAIMWGGGLNVTARGIVG